MRHSLLLKRTASFFIAFLFFLFWLPLANAQSNYNPPLSRLFVINGLNPQPKDIINPENASFLVLFPSAINLPFDPKVASTVSGTYVIQNGTVIQKNVNTDLFNLNIAPQDHEYYYMAYAEQEANGDYLISKCANLGYIYTEFDSSILPTVDDSVLLRECPNQATCSYNGMNRYELADSNLVLDSIKNSLIQDLSSSAYFKSGQCRIDIQLGEPEFHLFTTEPQQWKSSSGRLY